jgi:hypothetical protein
MFLPQREGTLGSVVQARTARLAAKAPRLAGSIAFAVGAAMLGANYYDLEYRGRFYAALFIMGLPLSLFGPWMVITGRAAVKGVQQPFWWRIGMYTLLGFGTALGVYLAIALEG